MTTLVHLIRESGQIEYPGKSVQKNGNRIMVGMNAGKGEF